MKTLKKTFYVLATLLAINFASNAQGFSPEQMVQQRMARMESELKLSKEQSNKIFPLVEASVTKMMEMRENGMDMEKMREAMKSSNQAMMDSLKTILTEDQMKKYQEMQERMRQGGFGQRPQN